MRYVVIAQLYWPIWLLSSYFGYSKTGMMIGTIVVFLAWMCAWKHAFGTYQFWKD